MNASGLHKELVAFCKAHADRAIVEKYSRYFKDGVYDAWGVPLQLMTEKVKEVMSRPDVDIKTIRDASKLLARGTKYEEVTFALLFYKSLLKKFDTETFAELTTWFETGIHNWAHSDAICGELLYPLLKKKLITPADFKPWIKAKNKFQRRAVPVALIKTLKTLDDFHAYFTLIEPLMTDPEREVHQGAGWFLREAWKLKPGVTEVFLLKWKEVSPRLIYQYACEKMSKEEKLRFKRTKL
jgi:3-methyladenine DNA glycosylase AlkD